VGNTSPVKEVIAVAVHFTEPKQARDPQDKNQDVKIIWKGGKIARVIFPSGKIVDFDEPKPQADSPD